MHARLMFHSQKSMTAVGAVCVLFTKTQHAMDEAPELRFDGYQNQHVVERQHGIDAADKERDREDQLSHRNGEAIAGL